VSDFNQALLKRNSLKSIFFLVSESNSEASNMSDGEADNGDVDMKPSDPNDLTAYNLDTYDEEESRGAGENDSF
jgi:hypothetical protein